MTDTTYRYYFAGNLFDYKALAGNALLAQAIEKLSNGRFKAILPQLLEMPSNRAKDIRNADYAALIQADLILAQFDGAELDSGTVAEFMVAKQLDMPAVLFRSDFRHSGDQEEGGDSWNLMLSHFPRTEGLAINGMAEYQSTDTIPKYLETLAKQLLVKLEQAVKLPPLFQQSVEQAEVYYQQTLMRLGMDGYFDDTAIAVMIAEKREKALL